MSPGAGARVARGIAWQAQFPTAYQQAGSGASGVVDFNRVHVVLHHSDGTIAIDTVINFPAGADSLPVTLDVTLLPSAPASGEPLSLNLGYIDAAGDTVFKGGPVGVTATPSNGGPPPAPVTIPVAYTGPGSSAIGVQISPRSGTAVSGTSFNFTAVAVDQNGTAIPGTPIVWNTLDPSIASVPSAASGTVVAGTTRGTARIVAQLLNGPTDQVTLAVLPVATTIAASAGSGQTGLAGTTLPNPIVVLVTAGDGLGVGGVTVTFAVASGGGSVTSATVVTNSAGLAQTTWKLGSSTSTQTVTATAGSLSGSPVTFSANSRSADATKLVVTGQPATTAAGATIANVTVVALTATGDTASSFADPVMLALTGGAAGATLGGSATVNAAAGVATFSGLQITKSGTAYSLAASSTGLTSAATNNFDITAAAATKLAFTVQPVSNTVGVSIGSPTVTAQDQYGNTATAFTGLVTLALASNPGNATISGTPSANAVAGVATFGTLTLNHPGSGYTLGATATGLAAATSGSFDIFAGGAASIAVVAGAGQSGNINSALAQPIIVQVQDLGGNGVAGKLVTFLIVTGGGSVSVTSGTSDASGNVSTVWTLGATVGPQSISATATGLTGSPLTINATGTVVLPHFSVTTQPGATQTAGVNITPSFVVQARDATNAPIPGFTGNVTIAIGTNPAGGTLSGTLTVAAVSGVATFSSYSIDKAATGYTLVASAAGYTSVTSSGFAIAPAAAATMAINAGSTQTAAAGSLLATPLAVLVTDAFGNPVAGRAITWAAAYGGGSVDSTTSHTNTSGIATTHLTLGPSLLTDTVTATSAGLTGSPLKFGENATGGIASTTVAPRNPTADTLTSIGATLALTATARDAGNSVVAGTYVWVSRKPSAVTVSATGLATAVTGNDSAWVVASESGGTKDSAKVVVQQLVATINVTSSSSNVYLGAARTFTAQAVDGLGHPLSVQPTFTWSSTAPAVATVSVNSSGVATGVSLGSAQIRATSGAIIGTASLNVNTIIQHVYVARDSAGFSQTANDVFNMAALQLHRAYKAFAYDTLNNPVTGLTFAWNSSNASVATLDTTQTARADALSLANGTATISATAQGVTGAAALAVAQVLASITVSPASPSIAVAGSVPMIAHGLDSNGQFIAGGTFVWTSSVPSKATVNSATGIVTGVALGTDEYHGQHWRGCLGSGCSHRLGECATNHFVRPRHRVGRPRVEHAGSDFAQHTERESGGRQRFCFRSRIPSHFGARRRLRFQPARLRSTHSSTATTPARRTITATDQRGSVYSASTTSVLAVQATMHLTSGSYWFERDRSADDAGAAVRSIAGWRNVRDVQLRHGRCRISLTIARVYSGGPACGERSSSQPRRPAPRRSLQLPLA